jgi:hypothetical protein
MLLSIANTTPRNIESVRTNDLLPQGIQAYASTLVSLLEHYYKYLNSTGLPSSEIGSISTLKDIDAVSMKYIDQIEELIGKSIPYSKVLNRVELYKIIVKYYNTRGSQDSIHTFFKIFFDQLVDIVYPREHLFDLSEGKGAWTVDTLLAEQGEVPFIRNLSDESTLTLGGITYDAKATDGRGQLISVEYAEPEADQYNIGLGYDNGIITVTPGLKSALDVTATDLFDGFDTYTIPDKFYFAGFGVDNRPKYSERIDNVTPWVGTPSRIEWDGSRWDFTIGSPTGDVFAFYSDEDVADPSLVTVWSYGWVGAITGSIDLIEFTLPVNAQIFDALLSSADVFANLNVSADALAPAWLSPIAVTPREYLTTFDLPTNVEPGRIAIVNGMSAHPFVAGIASEINGGIVWEYSGVVDEWVYENHRSFSSDDFKLFDGHYWQNYSYVVRSDLDSSVWYNDYLKFVHPAGLKMFSAIAIEIVSRNEWFDKLDYTSADLNSDDSWMQALIPPHALNPLSIGYHTPKYQPGYLRDRVLRYIYQYLIEGNVDPTLARLVIMTFKYVIGPIDVRNSFVRDQYLISEKFTDTLEIGAGMLDETIEGAEERYSNTNSCRLLNLSAIITNTNPFDYSFYDVDGGDAFGVWDASSFEIGAGVGSGDWDGSSYEII